MPQSTENTLACPQKRYIIVYLSRGEQQMSNTEIESPEMGTKPAPEHEWLNNLIGEWDVETTYMMGADVPEGKSKGREVTISLGGLWAISEGKGIMPGGAAYEYRAGVGYDISFKGYRGFFVASMSSHLWKYTGTMSEDGKVLTLDCVGPDMEVDGKTANYRDVIEIVDRDHRTLTSYGEQPNGEWMQFMKAELTRAK